MFIEKLVCFKLIPEETFNRLETAWVDQGFHLRRDDRKFGALLYSGSGGHRIRVYVKTDCLPEGEGTIVQMIYSPAITPVFSRPIKLCAAAQEKLLDDMQVRMTKVLDAVGEWEAVTQEDGLDHSQESKNPSTDLPGFRA